jgi:hypothetical protein
LRRGDGVPDSCDKCPTVADARPGLDALPRRRGLVPACTFTGGVPCVSPYGSTRAAFLADPGASLADP